MKRLTILGQELELRASPTFMQRAQCPLLLKLAYIDKVEDRYVRVNTMRGSASHDAIADLTHMAVKEDIPLREITDEMVAQAVNANTPYEIMSEMQEILRCVLLWRDRFDIGPGYMGREEKMALKVDDSGDFIESTWDDATYRGIIDYLEAPKKLANTMIVTDYKMSPHVLSQGELDTHDQLTFYAWLSSKMYPHFRAFLCRIWYLRYGFYGETRRTMDDLRLFEQTLDMKLRKLEDIKSWDPIPGDQCGYCDFAHLCPVGNDLSVPPRNIVTQTQAELGAGRLRVLEGVVSNLRKTLSGYVKHNDAVRLGGDFVYGFRTSTSTVYDPEELEDVLRKHGVKLSKVTGTIDAKKMKALIRAAREEDNGLAEDLEAIQKTKGRSEFKGYKIMEDENATDDVD